MKHKALNIGDKFRVGGRGHNPFDVFEVLAIYDSQYSCRIAGDDNPNAERHGFPFVSMDYYAENGNLFFGPYTAMQAIAEVAEPVPAAVQVAMSNLMGTRLTNETQLVHVICHSIKRDPVEMFASRGRLRAKRIEMNKSEFEYERTSPSTMFVKLQPGTIGASGLEKYVLTEKEVAKLRQEAEVHLGLPLSKPSAARELR